MQTKLEKTFFEQSFDESIEQAAEELERISNVQDLDDILTIDPFSGPTRITDPKVKEANKTVVVYFSNTSNKWKQRA